MTLGTFGNSPCPSSSLSSNDDSPTVARLDCRGSLSMSCGVKIHQLGSSILRKISRPVDVNKCLPLVNANTSKHVDDNGSEAKLVKQCVADLTEALDDFRAKNGYGRGIAANQVGQNLRIVVLNFGENTFPIFNPEITYASQDKFFLYDDCLSLDSGETLYRVERHKEIKIKFIDQHGNPQHWDSLDMAKSELLQHELDHLDGILSVDRATNSLDAIDYDIDVSKVKREIFNANVDFYSRFVDNYVIEPTV